ncbi:hypothetical protein ASG43_17000 [Aureimonas sp. Leaf454]|uniref:polysaccharide deacetylase family protein n=1 Tax=Aureimonas sp. Leaf454 TaxID=1736381 RepID=UPI0006FAFCBA|nr:polysaccharide deacetylase family protein [Aureimonas sp. Leaf454]KQT41981.1 hypothetical protein ASG43_17000 [Aureimonas sp. Leaf454]
MSAAVRAASDPWTRLDRALEDHRERLGAPASFWLRDDDAVAPGPALDRLLAIADAAGVPVSLAVIPSRADPALVRALEGRPDVAVLQHGFAHADHALPGNKSREFGPDRPLAEMIAEVAEGRRRLAGFAGFVPIFVPPWNRIAPALAAELPRLGFPVLSGYTNRREPAPVAGLDILDAHLDPVAWHAGRGLADTAQLLDRLSARLQAKVDGRIAADRPIGLLTHHLVHDEETFAFVGELLHFLARRSLAHWLSGAMLLERFGCGDRTGTT